ncbi:MAG: tetratricopeptide repeat protein, partial [Candidatus Acidiferrum sp.]
MPDRKKTRRQMLEEFVAKKPDDAFSRYGLAMECMNSGDPSAADAQFRALLDRSADYIPAYLMYAQFLARE